MDSHEVRDEWAGRSGEYSPEYYAHYGPDETSEAIGEILTDSLDRDAAVLELGCSSGRHLAHLREQGFENLSGVEVNGEAFDVMAEFYPDLADVGTFYHDAIEDVVADFDDDQFNAVFSVETLQHLHPDAGWVFADLARITDDLLVTVEYEGDVDPGSDRGAGDTEPDGADVNYVNGDFPLYYRNWHSIFTGVGFDEVAVRSGNRDTIRTFRA